MLSSPDWSKLVLRKTPGREIRFHMQRSHDGSVAVATTDRERPLSIADVALLSSLDTPSIMPLGLREQVPDCDQVVARLVFDGLVEVLNGNAFRTGPEALGFINDNSLRDYTSNSISDLAMHYALAIRHLPSAAIANRLYCFNSLPRTSLGGDPAQQFANLTGIDILRPTPRLGGKEWSLHIEKGWLYFRRGAPFEARFKLYLCPQPQAIVQVSNEFCEVLSRARGSVFKIAFPAGLLTRADKIVAYFANFQALQKTLSELARVSLNAPVQAVPFAAPVPGNPLLSWGVDPPAGRAGRASSWRTWVVQQVAECAHQIPPGAPPAETFDQLRTALHLRDIDPVQWLPRQQLVLRKWRLEL